MATKSDLAKLADKDEVFHEKYGSGERQGQHGDVHSDVVSPSPQLAQQPDIQCQTDNQRQLAYQDGTARLRPEIETAYANPASPDFPNSDGLHTNMRAQLEVITQSFAAATAGPDEQPLYHGVDIAGTEPTYTIDAQNLEVAVAEDPKPDSTEPTQENGMHGQLSYDVV